MLKKINELRVIVCGLSVCYSTSGCS